MSGDSGSPLLYKVGENRYRMCCILFASHNDGEGDGTVGWCFPASKAERLLGITFGNNPPVADAGLDQNVFPLSTVTLSGSATDEDTGDTLAYEWSQIGGETVTLEYPSVPNPNFTAPSTTPNTLTFRLKVTDSKGDSHTDDVVIYVEPVPNPSVTPPPDPEIWGEWTDTGNTNEDPIAGWIKEQSSTSNLGNTKTQWVPWPEEWPDTWTDTTDTRGSGLLRERKQTRTSNHGNTQTQWVPDPAPPAPPAPPPPTPELPIVWRPWEDTGTTRGCGPSQEKEQSRTSNRGDIQHRWMSDSRPEVWGSWSGTGRTLGSGQTREAQESRTSNCNNTQTRWVNDPETEIWYAWTDTGRTEYIDAYTYFREQARTSSYGNRETRWVAG